MFSLSLSLVQIEVWCFYDLQMHKFVAFSVVVLMNQVSMVTLWRHYSWNSENLFFLFRAKCSCVRWIYQYLMLYNICVSVCVNSCSLLLLYLSVHCNGSWINNKSLCLVGQWMQNWMHHNISDLTFLISHTVKSFSDFWRCNFNLS